MDASGEGRQGAAAAGTGFSSCGWESERFYERGCVGDRKLLRYYFFFFPGRLAGWLLFFFLFSLVGRWGWLAAGVCEAYLLAVIFEQTRFLGLTFHLSR